MKNNKRKFNFRFYLEFEENFRFSLILEFSKIGYTDFCSADNSFIARRGHYLSNMTGSKMRKFQLNSTKMTPYLLCTRIL